MVPLPMDKENPPLWLRFTIHDRTVSYMIILNTLALFFDAFPSINRLTHGIITSVDIFCSAYFVLEICIKVYLMGFKTYWKSGWNRFDFFVVLASLPSLVGVIWDLKAFSALLLLRVCRLIKFFRLLRFTPNGEMIWAGILRSLKASVSVFLALLLLNLLFAMGATFLFGELAPEYFGDPLVSSYSLFKVFTIEGWYEVPDLLYARTGAANWTLVLRGYYVLAVVIGGLLGFALANAVFVDEMTADNTNYVEYLVEELGKSQEKFRTEVHTEQMKLLQDLHQEMASLKAQTQAWMKERDG